MSDNDVFQTVVTGVEEKRFEFLWKVQNRQNLQKDHLLLEEQKFYIDTGKGTKLQSRWIVGFKTKSKQGENKKYYIYCSLLEIFSKNDDNLVCRFAVKQRKSNGQPYWPTEYQGRVKVNEGFEDKQREFYQEMNWSGYADETGSVAFEISLTLLIPLITNTVQASLDLLEEQFQQKSVNIAQNSLERLLESESSAFDVKIICSDGEELKCHKAILNANSEVFSAMLNSDLSESRTGIVDVNDISSKTMGVLLRYIYTGDLQYEWKDSDVIAEFVNAAGKYQLKELLDHIDGMLGHVEICPTSLVTVLDLANKLALRKAETELMEQFVKLTVSAKRSGDILSLLGCKNCDDVSNRKKLPSGPC